MCRCGCVCCPDCRRRRMFTRVGQRPHVDAARGRSCPSPSRCLMQLVGYGQRRRPHDADSRQPGDDTAMTDTPDRPGCCRCAGAGHLPAFVDACAACTGVARCRLPRCKWWKSLCTRVYLIAVNLASFVSSSAIRFAVSKPKILPKYKQQSLKL